jgi:plasmid stability protein
MERISFDIDRQEVADALHARAEAHGRSVEDEVAAIVEQSVAPKPVRDKAASRARIERLVALGRGLEFDIPPRQTFAVDQPEL